MEDKDTTAVEGTAEKKKRPPRNRGRRGGQHKGGGAFAEGKPQEHSPAEGAEHKEPREKKEAADGEHPAGGGKSRSGKRPSRSGNRRRRSRGEHKPDGQRNEAAEELIKESEEIEEMVLPDFSEPEEVEQIPGEPMEEPAEENEPDEELPDREQEPVTEEVLPDEPDVEIVGIRFRQSGKIYYFAPGEWKLEPHSHAIVETARGIEYGTVVIGNSYVRATEIVPPLRCVIRQATEEDERHYEENVRKEIEAYNVCVDKICDHKLAMKLIDAEYTFDNNKLLFYFTHDGRVDFRDLVKDLASVFRTRIEMRQINIRDEAKMMGGLGICGRPFCCHSFLGDFVQVSIKMAKEQNLSLNSAKISGGCGRLMCCLRYEYDVYEEETRKTPKVDTLVDTPDGEGVVIEVMPLAGLCKVRSSNQPDQPPKVYHRDLLRVKGSAKQIQAEKADEENLPAQEE